MNNIMMMMIIYLIYMFSWIHGTFPGSLVGARHCGGHSGDPEGKRAVGSTPPPVSPLSP